MRARRGLAVGAALLMLAIVAPPGMSVTGSGVVASALPIQLWGPLIAEGAGLVARGGAFDGALDLQRGRIELITYELAPGLLGGLRVTTELLAQDGALLTVDPGQDAQLLARGPATLTTTGTAVLAPTRGLAFLLEQGDAALEQAFPARGAAVEAAQGTGEVRGTLEVLLTDAAVRLHRGPGDVLDLDLRPESLLREVPSAALPPAARDALRLVGGASVPLDGIQLQEVSVKRVLRVAGEGALAVHSHGAALLVYARAPAVHVLGAAFLPAALGDVVLAGKVLPLRSDAAQAAGDFWLRAMPGDGDARRVSMAGSFQSFAVNGAAVDLTPAADGALVLGALAALGLASPVLKPLLGRMAGALYARIGPSEVLGSDVRRKLYEALQAEPGLSLSELSQRRHLSWGNTVHHLSVLHRAGLVVSLRYGRYRRWFVAGGVEQAQRGQVAALRNTVSAQVARIVLAEPGLSQKQLADRMGMSPQAIHWHLARLSEAGLVERLREGREVLHFVRASSQPLPSLALSAPAAAPAPAQPAP